MGGTFPSLGILGRSPGGAAAADLYRFSHSFSEAEELFVLWLVGRRLVAQSTADDYIRSIRHVSRHSGVPPEELRAVQVEAFLADPSLSWHTKNLRLIAVRMWHRWGALRGRWPFDPDLLDLRLRKQRPPPTPALTLEQAHLLLSVAKSPVEKRLAYPGLLAGLRPSEKRYLSHDQWFVGIGGWWRLRVQGKKTSPPREVPVHPLLQHHREEILSVGVVSKHAMGSVVKRWRVALDLPEFTLKWTRRTFAQALKEVDVEDAVIAALLGHSRLGVTRDNYLNGVKRTEMERSVRKLPYGGPTQLSMF